MSESKQARPPKAPRDLSAAEKLRLVAESENVSEEDLGEFLRRAGIHKAQLDEWRRAARESLEKPKKASKVTGEAKRIKELEKELLRKERALAEVAALLVLKKKVDTLWGAEGESTNETNE